MSGHATGQDKHPVAQPEPEATAAVPQRQEELSTSFQDVQQQQQRSREVVAQYGMRMPPADVAAIATGAHHALAAGAAPSLGCWITSLQLSAVQPACLRAHPLTPLAQQQQQQQQQQQHHWHQQGLGQAAQQPQQQQEDWLLPGLPDQEHNLLLHLEATLRGVPPLEQPTQDPAAPHLALPLQDAMLDIVVLCRRMEQLLHQQQFSLLELVQQQRHHAMMALLGASASTFSTAAQQQFEQHNRHLQEASSSSSKQQQTVCLNLQLTVPCCPTLFVLDCIHMVLTIRHGGTDVNSGAGVTALVAEVPLLVMPAAAQQEVQQLLLPAMRQEVQAEQLQQQQHSLQSSVDFASQCMQVEQAAWQHFCQLAHDVVAVMQLSAAAQAEAAAAAESSTSNSPGAAAGAADLAGYQAHTPAAALLQIGETLLLPLLLPFLASHGLHNTLQLLVEHLPPQLQQAWQQQQVSRLHSFTTISPPALQLPNFSDDEAHTLAPETPTTVAQRLQNLVEDDEAAQQAAAASVPSTSVTGSCSSNITSSGALTTPGAANATVGTDADVRALDAGCSKQQQQQCGQDTGVSSSSEGLRWRGTVQQPSEAASKAAADAGAGQRGSALVVPRCVPWYLPLTQFADGDLEQRYLSWKHHTLLHLDYFGAFFGVFYLAVLLFRMITEPTTLFFFSYILIKVLPHVPLMLGLRAVFLRFDDCSSCGGQDCPGPLLATPWCRELWLFMVAPTSAIILLAIILRSVLQQGQMAMLLPIRAYNSYWSSRSELATSILRPFTQHMRLRPYIVYTVLDAAMTSWVFGQMYGFPAAVRRWGFAAVLSVSVAWLFELYMRRQFVREVQRSA